MTGKSVKQTVNSQAARLTPVSQDPRLTPGSQDRGPGEKQPHSVWDSTRGLSQPEPARTSRCDHRAKSEVERRDAVDTDRGEHRLGIRSANKIRRALIGNLPAVMLSAMASVQLYLF
ncbi:uncharacterized protein LOC112126947 [Cimex lectularius]|uniref:Uncharacterized protein n=1 Tax=Cimex lectularius TaxID=79782 RepID=A0A8I6SJ43_CIMLE|nr:uncharacterized protein LOC112126947 [Cimex lectularius]